MDHRPSLLPSSPRPVNKTNITIRRFWSLPTTTETCANLLHETGDFFDHIPDSEYVELKRTIAGTTFPRLLCNYAGKIFKYKTRPAKNMPNDSPRNASIAEFGGVDDERKN